MSTTRAVTALAALIHDSKQRRCTAYGIALDVDSAGMLLSPETADEVDRVRGERDRYRSAWQSARERAQARGEGILRVVSDRESYQLWLRQAEDRVAELRTDNEALTKRVAELEEKDSATPAPASTPEQRATTESNPGRRAAWRSLQQRDDDTDTAPDDCETPHRFSARDGWRMVCGSCDHTQGATCHSTVTAPAATG